MKSKEEIEKLKVEIYRGIKESIGGDYGFFSEGYDLGYTQCQEDMADYIFEVARQFHRLGKYSGTISDTHFTDIYEETINSLNKQVK